MQISLQVHLSPFLLWPRTILRHHQVIWLWILLVWRWDAQVQWGSKVLFIVPIYIFWQLFWLVWETATSWDCLWMQIQHPTTLPLPCVFHLDFGGKLGRWLYWGIGFRKWGLWHVKSNPGSRWRGFGGGGGYCMIISSFVHSATWTGIFEDSGFLSWGAGGWFCTYFIMDSKLVYLMLKVLKILIL